MAKKTTLTVDSTHGTFTRQTARTYTHLVAVKGERAELLESERVRWIASRRREVARYRAILATGIDKDWRPAGTIGGNWDRECTAAFLADGSFTKWISEGETALAALEARGPITADAGTEWVAAGWCGRLDLAVKLAAQQDRYRHVAIIEVATGKVIR